MCRGGWRYLPPGISTISEAQSLELSIQVDYILEKSLSSLVVSKAIFRQLKDGANASRPRDRETKSSAAEDTTL